MPPRQHGDHGRRAVTAACRPTVDESLHESTQGRHIEGAMLQIVGNVVGSGLGQRLSLLVAPTVDLRVVDRLVLGEQFDRLIDPCRRIALVPTRLTGQRDNTHRHRQRHHDDSVPHGLLQTYNIEPQFSDFPVNEPIIERLSRRVRVCSHIDNRGAREHITLTEEENSYAG
jgi:hypothetical protein